MKGDIKMGKTKIDKKYKEEFINILK